MKLLYLVAMMLLILLAAVPPSNAGDCRQAVVVQKAQHYYAPATYYPQPLALGIFIPAPSYTVGLSFSDPATNEKLELLMKRFEALEQRLTAPPALPLQQSMTMQCAGCHNGSKADVPRLAFDNLTADQKALVAEKILDGSMPPKGGIPKDKRRALVAEFMK